MVKKSFKKRFNKYNIFTFKVRKHRFQVFVDKILIFNFLRKLHGRFWGIAAIMIFAIGMAVCFAIKPELLKVSTAFSDFGEDVRTAPYFAGACFFAAYGLWRWRNYLSRTLKRTRPIIVLLTFTILGLYLVALMPSSWTGWPYTMHTVGVAMMGISAALTVILDISLSKTRKNQNANGIRIIKMLGFFTIIIGGYFTIGSLEEVAFFELKLLGEMLMIFGYATWIILKTYQGEEPRSRLSKLLKRVVLID